MRTIGLGRPQILFLLIEEQSPSVIPPAEDPKLGAAGWRCDAAVRLSGAIAGS